MGYFPRTYTFPQFAMALRFAGLALVVVALVSCGAPAVAMDEIPEELVGMWAGIEIADTMTDSETYHPFWSTIEKGSMTITWTDPIFGDSTEEISEITMAEGEGQLGKMNLTWYNNDMPDEKYNVCSVWCRVGNVVFWLNNAVKEEDGEAPCPDVDEDEVTMGACGADNALDAIGMFVPIDEQWLKDHTASSADYMFLVEDMDSSDSS